MNKLIGKNEIIEAALTIAKKKGWEKTSVRDISKAINYSTIKIYSEFGNKEGLLQAIQRRGFVLLKDEYSKSIDTQDSNEKKLIELTVKHFQFSKQHKAYYDLMFQMNGSPCPFPSGEVLRIAGKAVSELLSEVAGYPANKVLFFNWWALAHGFIAITDADRTEEEQAITLLRDIMENFVKGIKK
ncbi:MAG: TetR/AcrR family transcriptional regulator [Bacteroidota bacterium]